jgi:hypothetical protein
MCQPSSQQQTPKKRYDTKDALVACSNHCVQDPISAETQKAYLASVEYLQNIGLTNLVNYVKEKVEEELQSYVGKTHQVQAVCVILMFPFSDGP